MSLSCPDSQSMPIAISKMLHHTTAEDKPFIIRSPSADSDELMLIAPSGRVSFMGFWQFCRFAWDAARARVKVEIQDGRK